MIISPLSILSPLGDSSSRAWTPPLSLSKPTMETGTPVKGHLMKRNIAGWNNNIYYTIYLPANYSTGKTWPVIMDLPMNNYNPGNGEIFYGTPEEEYLGYGLSMGGNFIVVVPAFVNIDKTNIASSWWGSGNISDSYQNTLDFWQAVLTDIETNFHADLSRVILAGFSRGAIASGYLGCSSDTWAGKFCAYIAHSHYDGGTFTPNGAIQRLMRMSPMKTCITYGDANDSGRANSLTGLGIVQALGINEVHYQINNPTYPHDIEWCLSTTDSATISVRAFLEPYKNDKNFVHLTHATGIGSITVENANLDKILITYGRNLNTTPPATSCYTILVNSVARTVNSISISGAVETLTLASNCAYGDVITVSYTKPVSNPLQDTNGVICTSFPEISVTNNIANAWTPVVFANLLGCTQNNGTLTATGTGCGATATKYLPLANNGAIRYTIKDINHSIGWSVGFKLVNDAPNGTYNDLSYGAMYHTNKNFYYVPTAQNLGVVVSANSKVEIRKTGTTLDINYADDGVNFVNKKTLTITNAILYIRIGSNNTAMVVGDKLDDCVFSTGDFINI